MTNEFRKQDQQYSQGINLQLAVATNDTSELILFAINGLNKIFKPGYNYKKSGVIVTGMVSRTTVQMGNL